MVQSGNGQHLNVTERIRHHPTRDQVGPTHEVLSGGRARGRSASNFRAWLARIIHQLATSTGGHWIYRKQPGYLLRPSQLHPIRARPALHLLRFLQQQPPPVPAHHRVPPQGFDRVSYFHPVPCPTLRPGWFRGHPLREPHVNPHR